MKKEIKKLNSVRLCLMAHPDNQLHSEFADRISDLNDVIDKLENQDESRLRDHFAGLAMMGEITRYVSGYNFDEIAKTAYLMAHAMLKARKENNNG